MATQYPAQYPSQYPGQYPPSGYGPTRHPAGWQPPFQGAPPIPAGVNVNPQHWQTGFWQFNPAYSHTQGRPPPPPNQAPWAAGSAWQAGPSQNPYKRVPRPPSAEYLATRLSDNPLGLSNMIPREELYGSSEGNDVPDDASVAPHTPWIWNPRGLVEDESDQGVITADYRDSHGRRTARESRGSTPSRQSSSEWSTDPSPSSLSHSHHRDPSQFRQASDPSHLHSQHHHRDLMPARHASEPVPDRRGSGSLDHLYISSSNTSHISRRHPEGNPSPTSQGVTPPSSVPNGDRRQDGSFTTKRELQPTFSPNIVRTPGHYLTSSPNRPISSQNTAFQSSSDAQLAARMERVILSNANNPAPLTRQASLPTQPFSSSSVSSSMSGVSSFVDEPSSVLSPLILTTTPKPSARSVSRHHSVPAIGGSPLTAIPETSIPGVQSSSRPSTRHASPAAASQERRATPPTHLSNPLPAPPLEVLYPVQPPPHQRPPPDRFRERTRKGFWNRRGDHLTLSGYIVYAPQDQAYPSELENYPSETEGYRDHLGTFSEYRTRPELPESLPRHGQPPMQPYESFVVYEYMQ